MKLQRASIRNYRVIQELDILLHPQLTVLIGDNAVGKTCVLDALAVGLGPIVKRATKRFAGGGGTRDIRRINGRTEPFSIVQLESTAGIVWDRRALRDETDQTRNEASAAFERKGQAALYEAIDPAISARAAGVDGPPLPVLAYYGTDRTAAPRGFGGLGWLASSREPEHPSLSALDGALSPMASFRAGFRWFMEAEAEELREQRDTSPDFVHPGLAAVRRAIEAVIPGATNPRVAGKRPRMVVTFREPDGHGEDLDLDELSGGYRSMLALVVDLARRMALANPAVGIESEAIVLIDEVDLHLHPRWQQTVVGDLIRAFPNAQFIVTTHSEQVIASVEPDHVLRVERTTTGITLTRPTSTYGARPDRITGLVMGLDHLRPKEVEEVLAEYWGFIRQDGGESHAAKALRAKLDGWFRGLDPELVRADAEIHRRAMLKKLRGTE